MHGDVPMQIEMQDVTTRTVEIEKSLDVRVASAVVLTGYGAAD